MTTNNENDKYVYMFGVSIISLLLLIIVFGVIDILKVGYSNHKKIESGECWWERYQQYPCRGATHYARVHRNNDEPCERGRLVCKEGK